MASEAARTGPSVDTYIGSLISLTSKSEIRYEGILYNINTEESSIGLRNVRSFGTEGRKKDGQQVPGSDKIYEYILFRGTDIKDLQVKSSPPAAQSASIQNDPAIIQTHYARPASTSSSLPSVVSGNVGDATSHAAQLGLPRSTFQGNLPLYQPGNGLGPWGSSPTPPIANGPGLAMPPMYWQGYYAPSSEIPHLQQQTLLRPPTGMHIPHSMQQPLHFPAMNASLPSGPQNMSEFPPPLLQPTSSASSLSSSSLPSGMHAPHSMQQPLHFPAMNASLPSGPQNMSEFPSPLSQPTSSASSLTSSSMPSFLSVSSASTSAHEMLSNKSSITNLPSSTLAFNLPPVPPMTSNIEPVSVALQRMPVVSSKANTVTVPTVAYQNVSQSTHSIAISSTSIPVETSVPLVTPGQLLQTGNSAHPIPQPQQTSQKDVEVKAVEAKAKPLFPESSVPPAAETKETILPLPKPFMQKPSGTSSNTHYYNRSRGRGRGRGSGFSRPVTEFTEDFDFMAMNEKFNKDEVWGNLGKNKAHLKENDGELNEDEVDYTLEEEKEEAKPVYVKDDFFDSLSSNTLDRTNRNGRTKFSEQLKIDSETFGDSARHRPGRGGSRGFRGGARDRGSYYGRGYGYSARGRGQSFSNRA